MNTTIQLPGAWEKVVQPAPMMRCANAIKIDLMKVEGMDRDGLNKLLSDVGQSISTEINKAVLEAHGGGIKVTTLDVRWVNIFSSELNPDGMVGFFRITFNGEMNPK